LEKEKTYQKLLDELNITRFELEEVRFRLEEANDIIEAIRSGEIDALVVKSENGHQLFTLKNADQTYRIFIEQMAEGAITLNGDGNILYSNSRFAVLVGLPLEKVIGQPFYRFVIEEHQNRCHILINDAWNKDIKGEIALLTSAGQQVAVLISLKTLDLDEGLSMSIILTDLTVQKETEKLLQEKNSQLEEAQRVAQHLNANLEKTVRERTSELEINIHQKTKVEHDLRSNQERLTRILETMAEGVAIVDLQGRLTYANPMAQKILGNKNGVLHNPDWQILRVDGSPLPWDEHPVNIAMSTGQQVYDYEISVQPPDKERFYISINAAPLYDGQKNMIGGIGTFMDVTNRRMQQQQKDDFISIASHELKTPITSLKAALQLLVRIKDRPDAQVIPNLIDQAHKSMQKVSSLVEELLNVSHMNDGQLQIHKEKFNLFELLSDCCQHVRNEGLYSIVTTGDKSLEVFADPEKVEQVVVNLVNNAVKYAPASKNINISIERVNDMAKISVSDKGPGISAENIPHLFDRYYRVDRNGVKYSGLGLGLYICAEIIKKHNGQIGVDSKVGEGSTFWFTLPI
jgi:two-component system CheB/CheR fusion protein